MQGLVDGPEEQRLLVFRGHYKRMGQKLRIVVAQDYTPILESFARVQWMGLAPAPWRCSWYCCCSA